MARERWKGATPRQLLLDRAADRWLKLTPPKPVNGQREKNFPATVTVGARRPGNKIARMQLLRVLCAPKSPVSNKLQLYHFARMIQCDAEVRINLAPRSSPAVENST
jgi:hypothetical protein